MPCPGIQTNNSPGLADILLSGQYSSCSTVNLWRSGGQGVKSPVYKNKTKQLRVDPDRTDVTLRRGRVRSKERISCVLNTTKLIIQRNVPAIPPSYSPNPAQFKLCGSDLKTPWWGLYLDILRDLKRVISYKTYTPPQYNSLNISI